MKRVDYIKLDGYTFKVVFKKNIFGKYVACVSALIKEAKLFNKIKITFYKKIGTKYIDGDDPNCWIPELKSDWKLASYIINENYKKDIKRFMEDNK